MSVQIICDRCKLVCLIADGSFTWQDPAGQRVDFCRSCHRELTAWMVRHG